MRTSLAHYNTQIFISKMTNTKMDVEEEALFRSYPYAALYFVQSPSTLSHANTASADSPLRSSSDNFPAKNTSAQQLALSHYSSSRGSSNSFLHEKKLIGVDSGGRQIEEEEEGDDDEEEEGYFGKKKRRGWFWRYFSYRRSSSCGWICLQIGLRLMVSFGIALLVFYIATLPPPPFVTLKIGEIKEFGLGEGVDTSGVTTKILNCNFTVKLLINNKSKLFPLHIHPPFSSLSFTNLPLALSRGPGELYAASDESTLFNLSVGTKNKPMYGAGRIMQDMLDSGRGITLIININFMSKFHVIANLIEPKFHHKAQCVLVIGSKYDKGNVTKSYHSSCLVL